MNRNKICLLAYMFVAGWLVKNIHGQITFGCAEDYCEKAPPCRSYEGTGRLILNGSLCGCCHVRMNSLKEGDYCNLIEMTPLPLQECGPGLTCSEVSKGEKKCIVAETKCNHDLANFTAETQNQEITLGKPKPECDEYGDYKAVQCKTGMLCYCVDKNGERIFGEGYYTEKENMNCQCSREYHEFLNYGLIEKDPLKFLRCDSYGSYSEPQCTEKYCYCIDKDGQLKSQALERKDGPENLPCFQESQHKDYITPCMKKLIDLKGQIESQKDLGITVIGVDLPDCDPDGSFAAKQCHEQTCYCVSRLGHKYNNTEVERYSQLSKEMKCNCVREKETIKYFAIVGNNNQFANYKCMKNGNYLPIQCITSVCYCVDENGFQIEAPKTVVERRDLHCHREEYEDDLNII